MPIISHEEFREARVALGNQGFTSEQRDKLEEIFRGDLDEAGDAAGIDGFELERGIKWLKEHRSLHHFSDHQIELIETELRKRL